MAYAFFDVDGTLISLKSMFSFQEYWYATKGNPRERGLFEADMARMVRMGATREAINRRYYTHFAGRSVIEVGRVAAEWFEHVERSVANDLYHPLVVERLQRHQSDGIRPVLVSGSFPQALAPLAERLGVDHILATVMEVRDGHYTGRILRQTIGDGKVQAIGAFLDRQADMAADCHAYGDDISDLPMLDVVGHPSAVRGDDRLEDHARRTGWEVLGTH